MKPMHMVESVTEKELIVLQRLFKSNEQRIKELIAHNEEIDKVFDKIDQGKILVGV